VVSPPGPATRRAVLKSSAVAVGGVALAGCGGRAPLRVSPDLRAPDVILLNHALAIEQRAIAAYTVAAPLLGSFGAKMAAQFLAEELLHAGELRWLIKQLRGEAHNPLSHYDLGHPRGRDRLLALLHALERRQVGAYLNTIARVSNPDLRQSLASILANDAQHVTVLRSQQGLPAMTAPLVSANE
jgi:bacterioferritin (cytochrome b1)